MTTLNENYRVGNNPVYVLHHIKGPYELNAPPNNKTFWGLNPYDAITLCYHFENLKRIYSVIVDKDTLRDYIEGNLTFREIVERNIWIDIVDGLLYDDDQIKRYLYPVAEIPEYDLLQMGHYVIPPPENKDFYLL